MALWNPSNNNVASQFGMPLFGVAGAPPFTGNYFWVDETNGSDGNTGGPQDPLATLKQAHSMCLANNNDVVFLTGSNHTTATIAWSKNKTHLFGLSPPSQNSRARIAITNTAATTGAVSPLVNVTAAGCWFQNVEVFAGINQAATQVAWAEAGGENYYKNCNFIQTGHATAAAQAGSRALTLASDENLFEGCTIGGDTNVRATNANYTMETLVNPVSGLGAARNIFRNCVFQMLSSDSSNAHINVGAGTIDRYLLLDNVTMIQGIESGQAVIAAGILASASSGGAVILTPSCVSLGATAIATTGPVYGVGMNPGGANSATTNSIAIKYT